MTIDLQVINLRDDLEIEEYVFSELGRVADHYESRLGRIAVQVSDEGHSRSNNSKSCSIDFHILGSVVSHVEAKAENACAAVRKAIKLLELAVAKRLPSSKVETTPDPNEVAELTEFAND
jgi:ribosome-associated translation inhibitor RaiA